MNYDWLFIQTIALFVFGISSAFGLTVTIDSGTHPSNARGGSLVASACGFMVAAGAAKVFFS